MVLTDWGPTFVGDTALLFVLAEDRYSRNRLLNPTWTVDNAPVAARVPGKDEQCFLSNNNYECAYFAVTGVGTTTITATASADRGRTLSGGTPTASRNDHGDRPSSARPYSWDANTDPRR